MRDRHGPAQFQIINLGVVSFDRGLELQAELASAIAAGDRPPTLLLLEHPAVFTLGRQARPEHLLWDSAMLQERGVEVRRVDRGGDITFHGPGQLVGYPLLPLGPIDGRSRLPRADYVGYLRRLEQMLIFALADIGLPAGQLPGLTGVWVQPHVASRCLRCPPAARRRPAKLASIGVRVDRNGISRHGFALNVAPDMSFYQGIVACGLPDHPSVSLEQLLDPPPTMRRLRESVASCFTQVFGPIARRAAA